MSHKGFRFFCWMLILTCTSCREVKKPNDQIFLKLQLLQGQKFQTAINMTQSMEADVNGVFSLIDQEISFELLAEVEKDSSGIYFISNTYQKLQLHQSQSDEENQEITSIDTDEDNSNFQNALEKYYYQLKNKNFHTQMNTKGQEIYSDLNVLTQSLGGQQFTSPFQKMFEYGVTFPDYSLKAKDVWYNEISVNDSVIVISGNVRYQLETWDNESIYIRMKAHLKGRYVGFNLGSQIFVDKEGTIELYKNTGWLKKASVEQIVSWIDDNTNENKLIGDIEITSQAIE